jgi:FdhD protein
VTTRERTAPIRPSTSGAVLAGGHSRRMGRDKRTLPIQGRPLLGHAVAALRTIVGDVVVVVAETDDPAVAALDAPVRVIADLEPGLGPLGGLVTALATAATEVVLVVPGDHPALASRVLGRLVELLASDPEADAALLGTDDRGPQPLLGAYRVRAATTVRQLLDDGERRARALVDRLPHVVLREADWRELDPSGRTSTDLDTPADAAAFVRDRDDAGGGSRGEPHHGQATRSVVKVRDGAGREGDDRLAGEEPMELRVAGPGQDPLTLLTTLRTPGHERDLALGWLVADGLLPPQDGPAVEITFADPHLAARPEDTVTAWLPRPLDLRAAAERRTAATASCGVCGRASIEELADRCPPLPRDVPAEPPLSWHVLAGLPERLRAAQSLFAATGGLHASGLFDRDGRLVTVREDVGRHNALDAAIGAHVRRGALPLHDHVAVLSGRIGFELVAKAAVAGIPVLAAVGAASDLAMRTAERLGVTLVGFLRDGEGTVYAHPHRLELGA